MEGHICQRHTPEFGRFEFGHFGQPEFGRLCSDPTANDSLMAYKVLSNKQSESRRNSIEQDINSGQLRE